jgi:hypothetical protein
MTTPGIIQILFILASGVAMVSGGLYMINGALRDDALSIGIGLALFFLGPLVIRICSELLIVVFRIHDTLSDVRDALTHGER